MKTEHLRLLPTEAPMTGKDLYYLGATGAAALRLAPHDLVIALPRLERINGRLAAQFFYYFIHPMAPAAELNPDLYLAIDVSTQQLLQLETYAEHIPLRHSDLEIYDISNFYREISYLEHCAALIAGGEISNDALLYAQALWMDCQSNRTRPWFRQHGFFPMRAVLRLMEAESSKRPVFATEYWQRLQHFLSQSDDPKCAAAARKELEAYDALHPALREFLRKGQPFIGMREL